MCHQVGLELGIEQVDTESHNHGDEARPNHRCHQNLLERMVRGEEDNALAADDVGEDEDERDGRHKQGLRALAHVAEDLGEQHGNQEVDDRRRDFGAEGI